MHASLVWTGAQCRVRGRWVASRPRQWGSIVMNIILCAGAPTPEIRERIEIPVVRRIGRLLKRTVFILLALASAVVGGPTSTSSAATTDCASQPRAHVITNYGSFVPDRKTAAVVNTRV